MDRRRFLATVVTGSVITGFDPLSRRWLAAAEAAVGGDAPLPPLDGVVVMDEASLRADSADEGNIVHRRPWAVLRPGSVEDIARMLRFCRRHGVAAAARGRGHTVFGQSQAGGGLVVETGPLATIHSLSPDEADVDAGVVWKDLFAAAVAKGVTPPIFTAYTALTVGGTLSVGGVGSSPREGVQVQRVRRLQVVTGTGEIVWCSPTVETPLFEGALAGLGQLGIMTRAVLELVPAPTEVRQWTLSYLDPHLFFRDLRAVLERGELDSVYGQIVPPATAPAAPGARPPLGAVGGGPGAGPGPTVTVPPPPVPWGYLLNVARYHRPGRRHPGDEEFLRGLSDLRPLRRSDTRSYLEFVYQVDVLVDSLKAAGLWNGFPRPWFDVFLPGQVAEGFVVDTFSELALDDVGPTGFGLVYPIRRDTLTRQFFTVPDSSTGWIFLFDILTSAPAPGPNTRFVAEKIARNRAVFERARARGGTLYPISATPMTPADWARQYGARYAEFARLKRRYDPAGILTPGVRMF
jgi:FAD/FMN-containing dehydrogenase